MARGATRTAWVSLSVLLLAWGAGGLVPLGLVASPPRTLYDGRLGGATREVTTPPAGRRGRYLVEVRTPAAPAQSAVPLTYVLHVGAGRDSRSLVGAGATAVEGVERAELARRRRGGLRDLRDAPRSRGGPHGSAGAGRCRPRRGGRRPARRGGRATRRLVERARPSPGRVGVRAVSRRRTAGRFARLGGRLLPTRTARKGVGRARLTGHADSPRLKSVAGGDP